MTHGRAALIKYHRDIVRLVIAQDLEQHGRKAVHGIGLEAFGIGQGREREECAIDIGAAIDEIKSRHGERQK